MSFQIQEVRRIGKKGSPAANSQKQIIEIKVKAIASFIQCIFESKSSPKKSLKYLHFDSGVFDKCFWLSTHHGKYKLKPSFFQEIPRNFTTSPFYEFRKNEKTGKTLRNVPKTVPKIKSAVCFLWNEPKSFS